VLIAGGTHGADALAVEWAKECGIPIEIYPAEWDRWPKTGPIWNQRMLDQGKPDLIVAFPRGRVTAGLIALANKASVEVLPVGNAT
jgi:hypothetical protein